MNPEHKNWISNGVDIQNISAFKGEKEILFQPFSFFRLEDYKINYEDFTVDIHMSTVGKCEILEDMIKNVKNGNEIVYNEGLNIITTKDSPNNIPLKVSKSNTANFNNTNYINNSINSDNYSQKDNNSGCSLF